MCENVMLVEDDEHIVVWKYDGRKFIAKGPDRATAMKRLTSLLERYNSS